MSALLAPGQDAGQSARFHVGPAQQLAIEAFAVNANRLPHDVAVPVMRVDGDEPFVWTSLTQTYPIRLLPPGEYQVDRPDVSKQGVDIGVRVVG